MRRHLADDGLFLLHTIGGNESSFTTDPWIERYIFPNSMIPSLAQVASAAEPRFVVEDVHTFGADYERTLLAWNANIERHRDELEGRYGARFLRMWRYYLLSCAGAFRARYNNLWQIVFSPRGVEGGYRAPR
jgi:cyclopropane-fatty-acyl-phospholipid synthase